MYIIAYCEIQFLNPDKKQQNFDKSVTMWDNNMKMYDRAISNKASVVNRALIETPKKRYFHCAETVTRHYI